MRRPRRRGQRGARALRRVPGELRRVALRGHRSGTRGARQDASMGRATRRRLTHTRRVGGPPRRPWPDQTPETRPLQLDHRQRQTQRVVRGGGLRVGRSRGDGYARGDAGEGGGEQGDGGDHRRAGAGAGRRPEGWREAQGRAR